MAADLKLERERSDGLLKSLNRLQAMVNELETLRGPNKLDGIRKEAAKVNSQHFKIIIRLKKHIIDCQAIGKCHSEAEGDRRSSTKRSIGFGDSQKKERKYVIMSVV